MNADTDVRDVLSSIRVPTLVLHRSDDIPIRVGNGRYLSEHIEGARFVELPGGDHFFFVGDTSGLLDEVEEFLTGRRSVHELDRVLATVLFTDIVGSTEAATRLGDAAWRRLLDQHDTLTRREVDRWRGRMVKSTGDGALATFDGPARAIRCAAGLQSALRGEQVCIRAGLHTGEIELRADDIGGIGVHIAAVWRRWPNRTRFWSPRRSPISWPVLASPSPTVGCTISRASRGAGNSSRSPGPESAPQCHVGFLGRHVSEILDTDDKGCPPWIWPITPSTPCWSRVVPVRLSPRPPGRRSPGCSVMSSCFELAAPRPSSPAAGSETSSRPHGARGRRRDRLVAQAPR